MPIAIEIDQIRIDGGTQARVELNQPAVKEYAEAMKSGSVFDPIVVFSDGSNYWLADGYHRYHAARRNGSKQVRCDVRNGEQIDAQLFAAAANASHGLRRTNADKRRAVSICLDALKESGTSWSENKVAKHCGVSNNLVSEVKTDRGERERMPSIDRQKPKAKPSTVETQNPPDEPETPIPAKTQESETAPKPVEITPPARPANGRPAVSHSDRKKHYSLWGQLVRYMDRAGVRETHEQHISAIEEVLRV